MLTHDQWHKLVERINDTWPSQPISEATEAEWLEELTPFDPASLWLAVRRCRRESHFRPQLSDLFDALDANEQEDRERRRVAEQVRSSQPRRRGVPMPPETRRAMEILGGRLAGDLDGKTAAEMINDLADQHERRTAGRARPETARDATRTCPECATSPIPGYVVLDGDPNDCTATWAPCRMCRPGRHAATLAGVAHLPCGKDGRPGGQEERRRARSTRP